MPRLLSIAHSYVVANNRRLAHEMAIQGRGRWDVTAVAPAHLPGDLRDVALEPLDGEACSTIALQVRLGRSPHLRHYERRLRAVLDGPWDVVHVWEEPYVVACAQVASAAPAGACVVPATFQNISKRYPPPFAQLERRVMRRAGGWIAFGEAIREVQQAKSAYASVPSRVIPPGVDTARFQPDAGARAEVRVQLGWRDETPVVGFLGRFVPAKGLSVLMEALTRVRQPWRALFVGGGPMERDLSAFAARHPQRVRVLTNVAHGEVPRHLNAMDVLCAPSRTTPAWREQFGRMLIEAMACGVPVVASRSGEIPHVVEDAGVLVDEADGPRWTAEIERLLADPDARASLSARGLLRAQERFSWSVVARAHLAFFDELITTSREPRPTTDD
jgi:glycosyltransferase involved in cell wall biosynthesis